MYKKPEQYNLTEFIRELKEIESMGKGNYKIFYDYGGSIFELYKGSIDASDKYKAINIG